MSWHLLQLSYQEFQKNNKSIADTIIDKYFVYERIGYGAFGSVYRGMDDKTKKQVAIKVLDLVAIDREQSSAKVRQIRRRLAKTQSQLMMKVHSEHVMKLYDVYENKWLKIMVIQFCNGGTLSQQILARTRIPQKQAIQVLKQLILGVADMHRQNIVHRDLKTQNIMSHNGVYKIVDLGFAKMIPPDSDIFGTVLGTIITMAPQVMRKQKYGLKADIWSIGVIFYEMIYGKLPYDPMKSAEMYDQILKKDIFPNGGKINGVLPSKEVLDLLKKLLVIDQRARIGWKDLINQQIFKAKQQLPASYRVTVNIDKLKDNPVYQRTQDDILKNLGSNTQPQKQPSQGKKVRVESLDDKKKQQKQKQLDRTQANLVQWAKANHLQCLKTQLIFRNIIMPIEERQMLNLKERKCVELMYLLIFRCFVNMSFVLNDFLDSQNTIVTSLKKTVQTLYKQVSSKFQYYSFQLKKQQDKISSMIGDRFSKMFKSQSIKQKDKFLTGIENIEFKKQQQIQYTYDNYIKELIPHMKSKDIKVLLKLDKYQEINAITIHQLINKNFYDRVEEICRESVLVKNGH